MNLHCLISINFLKIWWNMTSENVLRIRLVFNEIHREKRNKYWHTLGMSVYFFWSKIIHVLNISILNWWAAPPKRCIFEYSFIKLFDEIRIPPSSMNFPWTCILNRVCQNFNLFRRKNNKWYKARFTEKQIVNG